MQNETQTNEQPTIETATGEAITVSPATAAILSTPSTLTPAAIAAKLLAKRAANVASGKPANGKTEAKAANKRNAAKRVSSKPTPVSKLAKPAKPTSAERERAQAERADNRSLTKSVCRAVIEQHYAGTSVPFKPASDTFAPINVSNQKRGSLSCKLGTPRQAALLLALLTYGAENIKPNGHFVRGGFVVPARLVNPKLPADATVRAQPESGCLGNALGLTVAYVSGPTAGSGQRDAIYRIDFKSALKLIAEAFGDRVRDGAAALIPTAKPRASKAA